MGGLRQGMDLQKFARTLETFWRAKNGGIPRIEPYRKGQAGVIYVLKLQYSSCDGFRESSKFTLCHGQVMESRSIQRFLR